MFFSFLTISYDDYIIVISPNLIGSENEWKGNEYLMSVFEENRLKHVMEQEMQQGIVHVTIDQEIVMIQDQLMEIQGQDMNKGNVFIT